MAATLHSVMRVDSGGTKVTYIYKSVNAIVSLSGLVGCVEFLAMVKATF